MDPRLTDPEWDVVVVGAGSAGCAAAGRLSADPNRRVLVLEAGPAPPSPDDFPADVLTASSLRAADPARGHTWSFPTELRAGRTTTVGRGRLLGGSSAVNGAYHVRATAADVAGWTGVSPERMTAWYARSETDLDVLGPGHGQDGPIPVQRPAGELRAGLAERFVAAAVGLGVPVERDKNGDEPPGVGLVPATVRRGVRVNAALGYLLPHRDRPNLVVRGDCPVAAVLFAGDRAVGVRTAAGRTVSAGEVLLAAGSVKSPQLLALSGIGPADELRAVGVPVRHDRPGVGHGTTDHPSVFLGFPYDEELHPEAVSAQAAANLDSAVLGAGADPAGDLEVLLFARPFAPGGPRHLMCALQQEESRGALTLTSADPSDPPRIAQRYLSTPADRGRMRAVVRFAGELLRSGGLATGPGPGTLPDADLDAWIAAHLTTSAHLCGSALAGPASDPAAVVDGQLRVHGIRGLRVIDTSVVPVPRRGPAATALALGERAADLVADTTADPYPEEFLHR